MTAIAALTGAALGSWLASVLLVEQDVAVALARADRGYVLETGRIVLAGTGRALMADARVRAVNLGLGAGA